MSEKNISPFSNFYWLLSFLPVIFVLFLSDYLTDIFSRWINPHAAYGLALSGLLILSYPIIFHKKAYRAAWMHGRTFLKWAALCALIFIISVVLSYVVDWLLVSNTQIGGINGQIL